MDLQTVTCNNCGAALQVDDGTRFVTCRHCGSQLEIKRTPATITTELLNSIDQRTAGIAEDVQALRKAAELERLDRDWNARHAGLLRSTKNGRQVVPTKSAGIAMILIMGGFGLLWTIFSCGVTSAMSHAGAPGFVMVFPLFGIGFIVAAVVMGVNLISTADRYAAEQARYEAQRKEFLASTGHADNKTGERTSTER